MAQNKGIVTRKSLSLLYVLSVSTLLGAQRGPKPTYFALLPSGLIDIVLCYYAPTVELPARYTTHFSQQEGLKLCTLNRIIKKVKKIAMLEHGAEALENSVTARRLIESIYCRAYKICNQITTETVALRLDTVGAKKWLLKRPREEEFFIACIYPNRANITALLDQGVDIDARQAIGLTTMLIAVSGQPSSHIVRLLLERGASVNAQSVSGSTALMNAAGCCRTEIVRLLLEHGALVNEHDERGDTALHYSVSLRDYDEQEERLTIIKLLCSYGADTQVFNCEGKSALWLASDLGASLLIKALESEVQRLK